MIQILFGLCVLLGVRIAFLVSRIRRKRATFAWPLPTSGRSEGRQPQARKIQSPRKTLVVLGSGGHTSEMIQLIRNLPESQYHPVLFVKAETDRTSLGRVQAANFFLPKCFNIPRAREVGQSYVSSVYSTLYAMFYAVHLVATVRPELLICNGPGTCLPICVSAFGWRILGWTNTSVVFVESYCRVESMSLTGRLLYPWVDFFAVHWPQLKSKYPLTQCINTMIRHDKKAR